MRKILFGVGLATVLAPAAMAAEPERWAPLSETARAITGALRLAPDRVTFGDGQALRLEPLGTQRDLPVLGRRVDAEVFRVAEPGNPVLLRGNRLCGPQQPPNFLAFWSEAAPSGGDRRSMAVFSGREPPGAGLACATFTYAR